MGVAFLCAPFPSVAGETVVWGGTTNGVRVGLAMHWVQRPEQASPLFVVYLENTSSNLVWGRQPRLENRFDVWLLEPSGRARAPRKNSRPSAANRVWYTGLAPRKPSQAATFSLLDLFEVRSNGVYSVVLTTRLATSSNMSNLVGRTAAYFSLPPVTNTFVVTNASALRRKNRTTPWSRGFRQQESKKAVELGCPGGVGSFHHASPAPRSVNAGAGKANSYQSAVIED